MTNTPPSLIGHCHCGAIEIELPRAPEKATVCNCSLCRRIGGLWAYYPVGSVRVSGHPENTEGYVQGDKTLRTVRCKTCGCVTHWEPVDPTPDKHHGVNLRNFDVRIAQSVMKRRFDGADAWAFVDEAATPMSPSWPF